MICFDPESRRKIVRSCRTLFPKRWFHRRGSVISRGLFSPIFLLICVGLFLGGPGGSPAEAGGKNQRIKFATLAPEGSTWMKEIHRLADEVKKQTGGRVSFKFYPGGVSGDERDVIRKMRIGQIHAAGFTGVGLGEILPQVRVLDLPFLFDTDSQIQHVYEKMNDYFAAEFEKKGYVLLGWVPVGWIHFFSTHDIRTVEDLRRVKAWMWEGDPLVQETYKALGVKPIPLSITDVLMSLQTRLVDTVYSSPQGALALQWFTKVKTMSRIRMGYATGGVLISKKKFNSLPEDTREPLKKISAKYLRELVIMIQRENAQSVVVLQNNGVKLSVLPGKKELDAFHRAGAVVRKNLVGKLFHESLLDTVLSALREVK
ncbi:MAG: TRAP transporter substrate-binding protein DctP [Nitrospinaceae bacterium]